MMQQAIQLRLKSLPPLPQPTGSKHVQRLSSQPDAKLLIRRCDNLVAFHAGGDRALVPQHGKDIAMTAEHPGLQRFIKVRRFHLRWLGRILPVSKPVRNRWVVPPCVHVYAPARQSISEQKEGDVIAMSRGAVRCCRSTGWRRVETFADAQYDQRLVIEVFGAVLKLAYRGHDEVGQLARAQ